MSLIGMLNFVNYRKVNIVIKYVKIIIDYPFISTQNFNFKIVLYIYIYIQLYTLKLYHVNIIRYINKIRLNIYRLFIHMYIIPILTIV